MRKTCGSWLLAAILALSAGAAQAAWFEDTKPIMGTRVHVEFWLDDRPGAEARAEKLLTRSMAEMSRIDAAFSPYKPDSELTRLNNSAGSGWQSVSDELFDLLQRSARLSEFSSGAFDVTYASIGRYYDYREGKLPSEEEKQAIHAINYQHVELREEDRSVRLVHPQTYVDLGGIAKGYAVDLVAELLLREGITQASVSAGGDSRIIGDRRGEPWTVGVQNPRDAEQMSVLLPLTDTAVSTSGDYERFFEKDGVRFHHILDPKTATSARGVMSVTILGPRAVLTDGLSTTVFVLGVQEGLALINRMEGIDAILIDADGRLHYSDELLAVSDG